MDKMKQICEALVHNHYHFNTGGFKNDYFSCDYCGKDSLDFADSEIEIVHDANCPVLVAREWLNDNNDDVRNCGCGGEIWEDVCDECGLDY